MMYFPITQRAVSRYWLLVHARQDPAPMASAAREAVLAVDKDQPLDNIRLLDNLVGSTVSGQRLFTWVIATFAGMALALASIGIYGLMAYSVAQRRQEIGIRMALGAQRGDVLRLFVSQGVLLIAAGIAVGLVGAFVSSRLLQDLLFEVKSSDPATYIGVALLLALVALVACLGPAQRATKVDPMVALRAE
jgi:putative ABC transport system permease protein